MCFAAKGKESLQNQHKQTPHTVLQKPISKTDTQPLTKEKKERLFVVTSRTEDMIEAV